MSQPESIPLSAFAQLMATIEDRKTNPPVRSYTTSLFQGGVETIGRKILEETNEVVEAAGEAGEDGRSHFIYESVDLIYHLFVMLGHRDIKLEEVEAEIRRRFGTSGLDEKAARNQKGNTE
ncbi:MAG: phosphoribosyl-ATP diphosphatase [Planctomycetes bacterium]|nr:phosphoribosyl-ATP diphosphatase [Planctomycetota bacterium]